MEVVLQLKETGMGYYPYAISEIKKKIHSIIEKARKSGYTFSVKIEEADLPSLDLLQIHTSFKVMEALLSHILWMCYKLETMEPGKSDKADRWIGWMFAYLEVMCVITNEDSRRMAKKDSEDGNV